MGGGVYGTEGPGGKDGGEEGDALHRCVCREVSTGAALLSKVRGDLTAVERLCRGEAKATNEVRWYCYLCCDICTVISGIVLPLFLGKGGIASACEELVFQHDG